MNRVNETELSGEGSHGQSEDEHWQREILKLKREECQEKNRTFSNSDLDGPYCTTAWDEVFCWPSTKAETIATAPCPNYIHGFNSDEKASRYCTEDGTWYVNPQTDRAYTNYTMCIIGSVTATPTYTGDSLIREWLPIIKAISQVGYTLSFFTLIIAFIILVSIKKLRCPRNTLHSHLFLSFILRAFMALLKDSLFIDGVGFELLKQSILDGIFVQEHSNWECKLVTSLWQYFILGNYTWILMEGLYLHNLIFLAPFSDSSSITIYILLGWGLPLPVITAWVLCRINFDDSLCWTTHQNNESLFLIIRIPIILTIVINFVFFLNIIRVLLVKLQSAVSIETRKYRYRKWAKSTLVLVPLFGVHYSLFVGMSYYMGVDPLLEIIWLFCDQLFASFQGFFVSILYCIWNGEVRSEITKKWKSWRSNSDSNAWIPLHKITSRLQNHRSTHEEIGLSGATSMGGVLSNCTASTRQKNPEKEKAEIRLEREVTEEHQIEINIENH